MTQGDHQVKRQKRALAILGFAAAAAATLPASAAGWAYVGPHGGTYAVWGHGPCCYAGGVAAGAAVGLAVGAAVGAAAAARPVYAAPAAVYVAPPVVYAPPPVVYPPAVVYPYYYVR
jgi:hypothetical protein